jgi:MFS family permease
MVIIGLCMSAGAVLTAAITSDWSTAAIISVAALYGVSAAGCVPVVLAEVARSSPPTKVGAMTSGANLFLLGGFFVGPLVFGAVVAWINYEAAFIVLTICTLTATVLTAPRKSGQRADIQGVVRKAAAPAERT